MWHLSVVFFSLFIAASTNFRTTVLGIRVHTFLHWEKVVVLVPSSPVRSSFSSSGVWRVFCRTALALAYLGNMYQGYSIAIVDSNCQYREEQW